METEQEQVIEQEPINPTDEVSSEEVVEVEAAESTPAEEGVETAPTDAGEEVPAKKSRVQERIDELTRKNYEAAQEREYWRGKAEALLKPAEEPKPAVVEPVFERPTPRQEDFDTYEQYEEAVFDWRYQKRAQQEQSTRKQQEQQAQAEAQAARQRDWVDGGEVKYPDFKQVALREPRDGGPEITVYMAGAIQDSEMGHDVAYHLGQNPKEAARIAKLNPVSQVREIAKLEFKLQSPMQKASTKAPTPTAPMGGKETPSVKLEDMNYQEYKAYRERQLTGQK